MYKIIFYQDRRGKQPVKDYLVQLSKRKDKDSRIKLNKYNEYISALSEYGLELCEPYIKHLAGNIWELRPLRDRVLFAAWTGNSFVLLHYFMKTTQKTPKREIEKAQNLFKDFCERSGKNDERV